MIMYYFIYNKMQQRHGSLGITRQLYQIVVNPQKDLSNKMDKHVDPNLYCLELFIKDKQANHDQRSLREQLKETRFELQQQREVTFILKGYLAKIERIIYNKESRIFDDPLADYEKTELHLRELVRRLSDIHNQKLNAVPVVYRNSNLKVYRQTTRHQ